MEKYHPPTKPEGENNQSLNEMFYDSCPELLSAIKDGFVHEFRFIDGHVVCSPCGTNRFHIKDVMKTPRPCIHTQTVVYRIITPTGMMGYAVVEMKQDNDE